MQTYVQKAQKSTVLKLLYSVCKLHRPKPSHRAFVADCIDPRKESKMKKLFLVFVLVSAFAVTFAAPSDTGAGKNHTNPFTFSS